MARKKMPNDIIEIDGVSYTLMEKIESNTSVREVPYKLKDLVEEVDEGDLCRDVLIQRTDDQWTRKQKSKLIESILMGRPIGNILTAAGRSESQNYCITSLLDGLQRTTAIVEYVHGKFSLNKNTPSINCRFKSETGQIIEHEFDVAGKKFNQLPEVIKNFILEYRLTTYKYVGFTDEELDDVVYCVNNGKTPTPYQKMRFLLGSENMRYLQPVCNSSLWEDIKSCKAKNDSILSCVIRSLMILVRYPFENLSTSTMMAFINDEEFDRYVTKEDMITLRHLVDELAKIKKQLTEDELEALDACTIPNFLMSLNKFNNMPNPDGKTFIEFLREFWNDAEAMKDFNNHCVSGSGAIQYSSDNIEARQYAMDDLLDDYLDCIIDDTSNDNSIDDSIFEEEYATDDKSEENSADFTENELESYVSDIMADDDIDTYGIREEEENYVPDGTASPYNSKIDNGAEEGGTSEYYGRIGEIEEGSGSTADDDKSLPENFSSSGQTSGIG